MVQTNFLREVSPDELHGLVPISEYMTPIAWAGIFDGDDIIGHGCVSRLHGQAWAHDLKYWGDDKTAVLRIYRLLIGLCKERGVSKVMTDVSDERMISLYRSMGWHPKSVILEGDI